MNVGKMRHRITFQNPPNAQNSAGEVDESSENWTNAVTVWGAFVELSGREFFDAQKANSETTARFEIRYNTTINRKMRVKVDSRYFEITAILNPDGKKIEHHVMAKEVLA